MYSPMVRSLNEIYSDRDRIFLAESGKKSTDKIFLSRLFLTKLLTRLLNFISANYVRDTRTGSFVNTRRFIFEATFVRLSIKNQSIH